MKKIMLILTEFNFSLVCHFFSFIHLFIFPFPLLLSSCFFTNLPVIMVYPSLTTTSPAAKRRREIRIIRTGLQEK